MTEQEKLHALLGAGLAALIWALLWVSTVLGWGAAIAAGSVLLSLGVEMYQDYRKEGVASKRDALISSAPGLALVHLYGRGPGS
jgi:hypothetical protein